MLAYTLYAFLTGLHGAIRFVHVQLILAPHRVDSYATSDCPASVDVPQFSPDVLEGVVYLSTPDFTWVIPFTGLVMADGARRSATTRCVSHCVSAVLYCMAIFAYAHTLSLRESVPIVGVRTSFRSYDSVAVGGGAVILRAAWLLPAQSSHAAILLSGLKRSKPSTIANCVRHLLFTLVRVGSRSGLLVRFCVSNRGYAHSSTHSLGRPRSVDTTRY